LHYQQNQWQKDGKEIDP